MASSSSRYSVVGLTGWLVVPIPGRHRTPSRWLPASGTRLLHEPLLAQRQVEPPLEAEPFGRGPREDPLHAVEAHAGRPAEDEQVARAQRDQALRYPPLVPAEEELGRVAERDRDDGD